ncbi:MAG: DUF5808 domain-containing protein [Steroidobacteraceae bacterium]
MVIALARRIPVHALGDRTDDRYWFLGVFHFNRNDPAALIEKRFGIGYTLNFARPRSWDPASSPRAEPALGIVRTLGDLSADTSRAHAGEEHAGKTMS